MTDHHNLDFNRSERLGFPEVVYGASKPLLALEAILLAYQDKGLNALATKVQADKGSALLERFPGSLYDEVSGAFLLQGETSLPTTAA